MAFKVFQSLKHHRLGSDIITDECTCVTEILKSAHACQRMEEFGCWKGGLRERGHKGQMSERRREKRMSEFNREVTDLDFLEGWESTANQEGRGFGWRSRVALNNESFQLAGTDW